MKKVRCVPLACETMLQIRKILFWGPLGNEKHFGGGESGNRRTIRVLEKLGAVIIRCPKPYPPTIPVFRVLLYFLKLTMSIITVGWTCLIRRPKAIHISSFYGHLIPWEFSFLLIGKLLGIFTVCELRAGGAIDFYNKGSTIYRSLFRYMVSMADIVLCQGEEYIGFVSSLGCKKALLYPNYMEDMPTYTENEERIESTVARLLYFGRIVKNKRVDIMIRTLALLKKVDISTTLTLIGSGEPKYIDECKVLAEKLEVESEISWLPKMETHELKGQLGKFHFFIFPTDNPREGHSNSLTEAMAYGIVPICSDQGFNRSVVAEAGVIVETNSAIDFAHAIYRIWPNGSWAKLSYEAWRNVATRFGIETSKTVFKEIYG